MKKLVIFGTGDIAKLAHFYFTTDSNYEVVGFTVDNEYKTADTFCDLPCKGWSEAEQIWSPAEYDLFVALSYSQMNDIRTQKYREAKEKGYTVASYISSRCTYLPLTPPGENCFILEDNTIQPFVTIGDNVTLWSGNHIGHDSTIDSHTFIASHVVVSGHCTIGKSCFIGVNATLRNGITIADRTVVGAGAIVMKSTSPKEVLVPERTKVFRKNSDEITL